MESSLPGTVYFVHAVDTEGPLYEGLEGLFSEIREHFGIDLEPTRKNVQLLREKKIDLNGNEDMAAYFVRPDRIDTYNESWADLDRMHDTFMDSQWRASLADSEGNPYIVSWFCMDHVGFNYNPRRRAMGYHEIYKYYVGKIKEYGASSDRIYWHYHPASFSGNAHRMGYNYSYSENLHNEIIARRVIDHLWFPVANRPGGHIESYDINAWLEQWIPFDLANQSIDLNPTLDAEERAGRIPGRHGDWRGATTEWDIYQPDLYDFRKPGSLRRWISRCLNMNSRHSNMTKDEIRRAFAKAAGGEDVFVSYTNHDFRNMIQETEELCRDIQEVASEFEGSSFRWANAVQAFRKVLGLERTPSPELSIDITESKMQISVRSGDIWGPQPFLALKTHDGRYFHDNFILDGGNQWTYPFDKNSVEFHALEAIGVGTNDKVGNTLVETVDLRSGKKAKQVWNDTDW